MKKILFSLFILTFTLSANANHVVTDQWKYIPEIDINVTEDPVSGFNLELISKNFVFDPSGAGGENMVGHGHAHLYVNFKKVARVYSNWFHIPDSALRVGINSIRVSLNANNHEELFYKNNPIDREMTMYYSGQNPGHGHDHDHNHQH